MKTPVAIDRAEVQVNSQFGPEARTVLTLKFPTGEIAVDLTTYQAQRIRNLNRTAKILSLEKEKPSKHECDYDKCPHKGRP